MDVVAVNWKEKQILLGECKWGQDGIDWQIVLELIEKKSPQGAGRLARQSPGLADPYNAGF